VVCREGWSAGGAPISISTVAGFVAGLAVTLAASELLARGLTRLGTKVGFSEGLLGLFAALGADSPELSSAVIAITVGAGSVGVGVVVGSNLFNLAALLGLSALVAGGVRIRRGPLVFDAAVGLLIMTTAAGMVAGVLSPLGAALVIGPAVVAYVVILAVPRRRLRAVRPLLRSVPQGEIEIAYEVTHDRPISRHGSWTPVMLLPVAVAAVVGGSFVMVHEALGVQRSLHLSDAVVGTIVLAALTSLPNLWVALHFARTDRGTALFSSAMNSNSINLVGGLLIPALFVGTGAAAGSLAEFAWLGVLSLLSAVLPLPGSRMNRAAGGLIIGVYVIFVARLVIGS
jgi:cation:H+ antiporter